MIFLQLRHFSIFHSPVLSTYCPHPVIWPKEITKQQQCCRGHDNAGNRSMEVLHRKRQDKSRGMLRKPTHIPGPIALNRELESMTASGSEQAVELYAKTFNGCPIAAPGLLASSSIPF